MNELKDIEKIKSLLLQYEKKVVVDNDFERAYNLPLFEFKEVSKEDLIEVLFLFVAIMQENELDLSMILSPSEN